MRYEPSIKSYVLDDDCGGDPAALDIFVRVDARTLQLATRDTAFAVAFTQKDARELLPLLQHFAETGRLLGPEGMS